MVVEMDRIKLLERIKMGFSQDFSDAQVRILRDRLPTGVEFIVTSSSFQGMSRAERMHYMVSKNQEIFGREFFDTLIIGSALTESEFLMMSKADGEDQGSFQEKSLDQSASGILSSTIEIKLAKQDKQMN
jgi:hypothetical protein